TDAEDQQKRRPRSLGKPGAAAPGGRRAQDGPGHRPIEPQRRRTGYAAHDNQAPGGNDPAHNVRRRQAPRATQPSPRPGADDRMGADSGTASLIEGRNVVLGSTGSRTVRRTRECLEDNPRGTEAGSHFQLTNTPKHSSLRFSSPS